jgi:5'-3' exonuclease
MILIDYSGVSIAAITGFMEDLKKDEAHIENLIRHVIISTIKNYKKMFHKEYGEVVIACDSSPYWRTEVFEHYKANRKKNREQSDIPWHLIHKYMDATLQDLREAFPYKIVKVPGAEADDVIGILSTWERTEPLVGLLDDSPEKTVIVSRDKDMSQLLTHPNIRHFNPFTKKFVKLEMSAKLYLRRLILTGDTGDGIPNVFSPRDAFVSGIRQKPATEKKMQPLLEAKNMIDAAPDDATRERIIENTRLIALGFVPTKIKKAVINEYNVLPIGNKMTMLKYFATKGMKQMAGDLDEF